MTTAQCKQYDVVRRIVVIALLAIPLTSMLSTFLPQTIPIVLEMRAPGDAEVHLRWGESPWQTLPLAPQPPPGSTPDALSWTGTLPSQPVDRLWLRFGKVSDEVTFVRLTVGQHRPQVWTAEAFSDGKAQLVGLAVQHATPAEVRLRVLSTPAEVHLPDVQPIRPHDLRTALVIWLGVVLGIGVVFCTMAYVGPRFAQLSSAQSAWLLAGACAALAVLRDAILLWGFSYSFYPDSHLYVHLGSKLFDLSTRLPPAIVTLPYPLMHALTRSDVNPLGLIWLHIGLGALAVFAVVYVLGRTNRLLAAGVGVVLALDVVWGSQNRSVLTEGPVTSFALLSLAWMLNHFDRRQRLPAWELLLAGLLYGWTCAFRPSNLLLIICLVPVYLWLTRSWFKTAAVVTGVVLFLLASASANFWRSGFFRMYVRTGAYIAYPIFAHHLFAPDNGPVSRQLDQRLRACVPDLDYRAIAITNSIAYIHGTFVPCLVRSGWTEDEVWDQLSRAYLEAVRHRPVDFLRVVLSQSAEMLAYELWYYPRLAVNPAGSSCGNYAFCPDVFARRFAMDHGLVRAFEAIAPYVMQAYQIPGHLLWGVTTIPTAQTIVAHGVFWLLTVGLVLVWARGRTLLLGLASAVYVLYTLTSVAAGHVIQTRYAVPLYPFYNILSMTALVALLQAPATVRAARRWRALMRVERPAVVLAGICALVALLRDSVLLWGFSYGFYPDSHAYAYFGAALFNPLAPFPSHRYTLPYLVMHAFTHSVANPLTLVWLHIGLGALAVFAVVYVLGRTNRLLAAGVGVVLALDVVWGSQNRSVLTEGPVTSFALLSLAWMLNHFDRRQRLPAWELLLAGLLYGWTCSFRPNYLLLLLGIVPIYGWLSRSWRKTGWLLTGLLLLLGVSASLNLWRSGAFRVYGQAGYYLAFPLFTDQLFAPDNGPVSRQLQHDLQACIPGFQPRTITVANAHDYILGQFLPCLTVPGRHVDAVWWQFTQAYVEALMQRPGEVLRVLISKGAEMLAYELYWYPGLFMRADGNSCAGFAFCAEVFVRRLSPESLGIKIFEALAQATLQLYQVPGRLLWGAATMPTAQTRSWHAGSWVLLVTLLLAVTRGRTRFLVGLSTGFILSVLVSVAAGHVVQMRYALPLHPFYNMLSVVMIITLVPAIKCGIMRGISSILSSLRGGKRDLVARRRRGAAPTPMSDTQT